MPLYNFRCKNCAKVKCVTWNPEGRNKWLSDGDEVTLDKPCGCGCNTYKKTIEGATNARMTGAWTP